MQVQHKLQPMVSMLSLHSVKAALELARSLNPTGKHREVAGVLDDGKAGPRQADYQQPPPMHPQPGEGCDKAVHVSHMQASPSMPQPAPGAPLWWPPNQQQEDARGHIAMPPPQYDIHGPAMQPPPMQENYLQPPPMQGNHLQPPPMQVNHLQAPPMQKNYLQPPPMQGSHLQPPPMHENYLQPPPMQENHLQYAQQAHAPPVHGNHAQDAAQTQASNRGGYAPCAYNGQTPAQGAAPSDGPPTPAPAWMTPNSYNPYGQQPLARPPTNSDAPTDVLQGQSLPATQTQNSQPSVPSAQVVSVAASSLSGMSTFPAAASQSLGTTVQNDAAALLTKQLNAMHAAGTLLRKRYRVLGLAHQRSGAQGIVRFATHKSNPEKQYALKFFLDKRNFDTEQALYTDGELHDMLPPIDDVSCNEDEPLVLGHPLPPVIVTERGESLDVWVARRKPDFFMCVSIVGHLAERVVRIHSHNFVHRDLKPANVMWLPSDNKFTVIDFGTAARVNTQAPICCTLPYAPPEVVTALAANTRTMPVTGALDVWSLGVIFYEFLTGTRVFTYGSTDIHAAAAGNMPYPWEAIDTPAYADGMRRMGCLQQVVLSMLARDPAARATVSEVNSHLMRIMQRESTRISVPEAYGGQ